MSPTEPLSTAQMIAHLRSLANPENVAGMARFGINSENTLGISIPELRKLAAGRVDHALALELWATGIHEARILAALVDDPHQVTPEQMESWAQEFDSWDVCDQVCGNLFDRTPHVLEKAHAWAVRPEEFVRRAGFALMAYHAVHAKKAPDEDFLNFIPLILEQANDPRNFVKKAVNWALRQIGKRKSPVLRQATLAAAETLSKSENSAARWVGKDALRELQAREE